MAFHSTARAKQRNYRKKLTVENICADYSSDSGANEACEHDIDNSQNVILQLGTVEAADNNLTPVADHWEDKEATIHNSAGAGGYGFRLLQSMGWTQSRGLGAQEQGIVEPIKVTIKPDHAGVGFEEARAASQAAAAGSEEEAVRRQQEENRARRDARVALKLKQEAEALALAEKQERAAAMALTPVSYSTLVAEGHVAAPSSSDPYNYEPHILLEEPPPLEGATGRQGGRGAQCPHCSRRFDTPAGMQSHISARHGPLVRALKRQKRAERTKMKSLEPQRQRPGSRRGGQLAGGSIRSLVPQSQDFSLFD